MTAPRMASNHANQDASIAESLLKMSPDNLIAAKRQGTLKLEKDSMFFMHKHERSEDLWGPTVVLRKGTTVAVHKTRRFQGHYTALLLYIDKTGKVWWSWTHAED